MVGGALIIRRLLISCKAGECGPCRAKEQADMARNARWLWGGSKSRVTDEDDGKGWERADPSKSREREAGRGVFARHIGGAKEGLMADEPRGGQV